MISPENLITVTLHATVPFMGCLFIKLTPFETINLVLQRARPAPVRWEGISSFPGHTWSPLLITTPPRLLDFCLSPFSGVLSHFSNCLYDIQNLLGINGLCINIPIRYYEYLRVYFLERSIFSVEQQSTPGCPDNQSCFFFFSAHHATWRAFKTFTQFQGEWWLWLTSCAKTTAAPLVMNHPGQFHGAL